jgi:signal transduction histidine kinase
VRLLDNLSIRGKLLAINVISATVALVLACAGLVLMELRTFRQNLEQDLNAKAQMVGNASTAAVAFGDRQAARETLQALMAEPQVLGAALFDNNGRLLASQRSQGADLAIPESPQPEGFRSESRHMEVMSPILLTDRRIGWVYVCMDTSEARDRLYTYLMVLGGVFLACVAVAISISSVLQGLISEPIQDLAHMAEKVAQDRDYRVRARKRRDDEIGQLVDRFNEMLDEVHARDEALQAAQDQLEQRVSERTADLEAEIASRRAMEESLRKAMRSAEEANRAKSSFLANMSHELRTPLNAIIGYSEMLEEDAIAFGDPGGCSADLRKIRSAGLHLLILINDVLDLSKIEAGRMELHYEPIDLSTVLREVRGLVEPLALKNGTRIEIEVPEEIPPIEADLVRFRQSLLNLASNACHFTKNGLVQIRVSAYEQDRAEWMAIEVRDTGTGIEPEMLAKLFQPFSQADSSRTRTHGGTGLGLAISQRLCRMMDGHITVESEFGTGSSFTIHLPVRGDGTGVMALPVTSAKPRPEARILLIDDDENSAFLLERQFAREGIAVDRAADGDAGLVLLAEQAYRAVVLDLRMPGMSGQQVLEQMYSREGPRPPVFVYSILDNDSLSASDTMRIRGYFQKPLGGEKLVSAVINTVVSEACQHAEFAAMDRVAEGKEA